MLNYTPEVLLVLEYFSHHCQNASQGSLYYFDEWTNPETVALSSLRVSIYLKMNTVHKYFFKKYSLLH